MPKAILWGEKRSDPNPIGKRTHLPVQLTDTGEVITDATPAADGETLINETAIPANTTAYEYFEMDNFRYFVLQAQTLGVAPTDVLTVTVEATAQDDGTAQALCDYQDVTDELWSVLGWIDTDFMAICNIPVAWKYVRVKYTTSNTGGNDCDLTVYLKRMS